MTQYGINKNISFKGYIIATVDERILLQTTEEIHEHAVEIANQTPEILGTDQSIERFITSTEKALIDETIKQLTAYRVAL